MQVYRGMEIGTAQPTEQELGGVRIHCCGVLDPDQPFNAKRFLDLSDLARETILSRGSKPLYVGGTGLYLRALRWGLFEEPSAVEGEGSGRAQTIRADLQAELEILGPEVLHDRLRRTDPRTAERTSPTDGVRIVRALEVARATGLPLSTLQRQWDRAEPRFPHQLVVLCCPRDTLVERIEKRVDAMLAAGWIDEVRKLLHRGYPTHLHAFKALGYREIFSLLRGELTEQVTRDRIKARTRQFSKRQLTWFRKEREVQWIQYSEQSIEEALATVENLLVSTGIVH